MMIYIGLGLVAVGAVVLIIYIKKQTQLKQAQGCPDGYFFRSATETNIGIPVCFKQDVQKVDAEIDGSNVVTAMTPTQVENNKMCPADYIYRDAKFVNEGIPACIKNDRQMSNIDGSNVKTAMTPFQNEQQTKCPAGYFWRDPSFNPEEKLEICLKTDRGRKNHNIDGNNVKSARTNDYCPDGYHYRPGRFLSADIPICLKTDLGGFGNRDAVSGLDLDGAPWGFVLDGNNVKTAMTPEQVENQKRCPDGYFYRDKKFESNKQFDVCYNTDRGDMNASIDGSNVVKAADRVSQKSLMGAKVSKKAWVLDKNELNQSLLKIEDKTGLENIVKKIKLYS